MRKMKRSTDAPDADRMMVEDDLLDLFGAGHPAAFASDNHDRIVFWNRGAADLLGRRAEEVLGRRCYEIAQGRDVFGNRFCYPNCAVTSAVRAGETVNGFELELSANGCGQRRASLTILRIPGTHDGLFTLLHVLQPIELESRLSRELRRLGARVVVDEPDPAAAASADVPSPHRGLTRREREILGWMAAGLQNKEIAQKLHLSPATVRNHVHNILDKLGVHSKLEAVCLAFRSGWMDGHGLGPEE
jgi:DNA-binding CsgD family transcriptional regulator